ncbi:MAG: CoA transferase [Spongiibacteraceae bacterium]|nr:CoA transferase [Spongiibacteraceae bacterium]
MKKISDKSSDLPLSGLRILDLCDENSQTCGRLLADLGAEVVLVEAPQGCKARAQQPLYQQQSLHFSTHNINKRSVLIDIQTPEGKKKLLALCKQVDVVVESFKPGELHLMGLGSEVLRAQNQALMVIAISDFGQSGPYRDFHANNMVQLALSGVLARSGIKGHEPLLPPGEMALEAAAVQAVWVVLLGYIHRVKTGQGGYMDFSVFEASAQLIDPGLGATGSAAGGKTAAQIAAKGRPPVSAFYPIFPCADGYVRLCILNPRQWKNMSQWLGDEHPFTDPSYGQLGKRFRVIKEINALIQTLFLHEKTHSLVEQGQARDIPIARLASPQDVFNDEHFCERDTFIPWPIKNKQGLLASGYLDIDGERVGVRSAAPELGEHTAKPFTQARLSITFADKSTRPLAGIRVLDLGVIVAGAELGRLLSDQGADVIKIENKAFSDGLRQSSSGEAITVSFAQGSRGKRSLGLNLRSEQGIALFKKLAAQSDIVLSNFKPGTMESLGINYEVLSKINPRIIMADSSALGNSGPRSRSMGYGPLVRATTGLSGLWKYPDRDDGGFSDGITIYPDHFAARVSSVGIAALLIRRQRTGKGGVVSVSQAECILNTMSTEFLLESLQTGSLKPRGNRNAYDAPNTLFPCKGDDQWCAVCVENDENFQQLCLVIGREDWQHDSRFCKAQGRLNNAEILEQGLSEWTCQHSPEQIMNMMQAAGIAAGKMHRVEELETNPHLLARNFIRTLHQPGINNPLATENAPVAFSQLPEPDIRPAPLLGEHTREIAKELLAMSEQEVDQAIEQGILEQFQL